MLKSWTVIVFDKFGKNYSYIIHAKEEAKANEGT